MFCKSFHGRNSKCKMNIDIMGHDFFCPLYNMQLIMLAYFFPDMFVVMKRLCNPLKHHYLFVKVSALIHVYNINSCMIKMRTVLCKNILCGKTQDSKSCNK